jgi:hypothetical protein
MIERKAYAGGGENDQYGKPISPDAIVIRNCMSHPSDGPVEFDGHTHLLIHRVPPSSMSSPPCKNCIQR